MQSIVSNVHKSVKPQSVHIHSLLVSRTFDEWLFCCKMRVVGCSMVSSRDAINFKFLFGRTTGFKNLKIPNLEILR